MAKDAEFNRGQPNVLFTGGRVAENEFIAIERIRGAEGEQDRLQALEVRLRHRNKLEIVLAEILPDNFGRTGSEVNSDNQRPFVSAEADASPVNFLSAAEPVSRVLRP